MIWQEGKWYNRTMTIKKPRKAPEAAEAPAAPAAGGGATIADRFKLDMPEKPVQPKTGGGVSALVALIAGLLALGVAGILTFIIYQHWEFLKAA